MQTTDPDQVGTTDTRTNQHGAAGGSASDAVHGGDFGANQWLVQDMYETYLADPNSLAPAWHDFFADYGKAGTPARTSDADAEAAAEEQDQLTAPTDAAPTKAQPTDQPDPQPSARAHPAEARCTFTGKQATSKPSAGRHSRLCSFSICE